MAAKETKLYKSTYYSGKLTSDACAMQLKLTETDVVQTLKHAITLLTDTQVAEIIETKQNPTIAYAYSGTLKDYQTVGTAFMYYGKSVLLGDEVGLGKTVETAALINVLYEERHRQGKPFNWLFLGESTAVAELRRKLVKFTGRYVHCMPTGEQAQVIAYRKYAETAETYSLVAPHSVMRSTAFISFCAKHTFDLIVFDESSVLRAEKGVNEIYRNTQLLTQQCERVVLLNATPLEVSVRGFYNQLRLLDSEFLPNITAFEDMYCTKKRVNGVYKVTGAKNLDILRRAISLRYIARTRKQFEAMYEDNHTRLVLLEPCAVQRKLAKVTSLWQQLSDYPPAIQREVPATLENIPKAWGLLAVLNRVCKPKSGNLVLVYIKFRECQAYIQEMLTQHGYSVVVLNGSTPTKKRIEYLDKARAGVYDIVLTNTMRSFDLSECKHCILYTIDTTPLSAVQFEGRITRDFDVVGKTVWLLCQQGRESKALYTLARDRAIVAEKATTHSESLYLRALIDKTADIINVSAGEYTKTPVINMKENNTDTQGDAKNG